MRRLVDELNRIFEQVHAISRDTIGSSDFSVLNRKHESLGASPCELFVRSAARVEQTCGGIMTRLWDDPFEWTLPESFPDKETVLKYLEEVAAVRNRAFEVFQSDAELSKEIPAPIEMETLFSLLIGSLVSSSQLIHLAIFVLDTNDPEISL